MGILVLYQGSPEIVGKPKYGYGRPYNDYGVGFYCTESQDLAREWASNDGAGGYANCYKLETDGLSILNLTSSDFGLLNWLAILLDNRMVSLGTPIANKGREYLLNNFLPDYKGYDVIVGYRADDSYFSFVRAFLTNQISFRQLERAMKLGKLGEQIVLKSEKSFEAISFIGTEKVDGAVCFVKRSLRDIEARSSYFKELEEEDIDGLFMRDILRGEIRENDPRLF